MPHAHGIHNVSKCIVEMKALLSIVCTTRILLYYDGQVVKEDLWLVSCIVNQYTLDMPITVMFRDQDQEAFMGAGEVEVDGVTEAFDIAVPSATTRNVTT